MKVESITFRKINDLGLTSKVVCPHIDYFIKDLLTTLVVYDSIYVYMQSLFITKMRDLLCLLNVNQKIFINLF